MFALKLVKQKDLDFYLVLNHIFFSVTSCSWTLRDFIMLIDLIKSKDLYLYHSHDLTESLRSLIEQVLALILSYFLPLLPKLASDMFINYSYFRLISRSISV